ncbi:MAG: DUF6036 family nucleotidyltransferase [Acidimicrobiales bacterium]
MSEAMYLDRARISYLFEKVAQSAQDAGIRIDMFLVGGAAMTLAYSTVRVTKDIDAIFEPKAATYAIVRKVADEEGLPSDWVNDAVNIFYFPGNDVDPNATVLYESGGFTIRVASPRYLFKMKVITARASDEDDLHVLWPLCDYGTVEECLADLQASYPEGILNPSVRYRVEDLASHWHGEM